MNNKSLFLFTNNYPYGKGEQFLETEIKYLAKVFETIYVFPFVAEFNERETPGNVFVINLDFENYSTRKGIKALGFRFFQILFSDFKSIQKKQNLSLLLQIAYKSRILLSELKKISNTENCVFYSYWFNDWTTMLSFLKLKNKISGFISRAHGYDLYEYRAPSGKIPFRKVQLKFSEKIFCISKDGFKYLSNKYPKYQSKIKLSYLGVINDKPLNLSPEAKNTYLIVTCARLIPIKRIGSLINILSNIEENIKWIHFGEGDLFEDIKESAENNLPSNVQYDFKGQVTNTEIYNFYNSNFVDLFINLSKSEGLPVSIMEAISFGIPVIATDVGGTSEIVTKQTGVLIPADFDITDTKNLISDTLRNISRNFENRENIKKFWNQNFNAESNYSNFTDTLYSL